MPNLNHFCDPDPERNHFKDAKWFYHKAKPENDHLGTHVHHEMCKGEEIINYGTKRQQLVSCDCGCHYDDYRGCP